MHTKRKLFTNFTLILINTFALNSNCNCQRYGALQKIYASSVILFFICSAYFTSAFRDKHESYANIFNIIQLIDILMCFISAFHIIDMNFVQRQFSKKLYRNLKNLENELCRVNNSETPTKQFNVLICSFHVIFFVKFILELPVLLVRNKVRMGLQFLFRSIHSYLNFVVIFQIYCLHNLFRDLLKVTNGNVRNYKTILEEVNSVRCLMSSSLLNVKYYLKLHRNFYNLSLVFNKVYGKHIFCVMFIIFTQLVESIVVAIKLGIMTHEKATPFLTSMVILTCLLWFFTFMVRKCFTL